MSSFLRIKKSLPIEMRHCLKREKFIRDKKWFLSLLWARFSFLRMLSMLTRMSEVGRIRDDRENVKWRRKNQYSLWMGFVDTSDHEIFALMLSPILRQRCWHDVVEAYCRGTIWQSLVQLEFQCASSSLCTFCFRSHKIFLILSQHLVWVVSSWLPQDGDLFLLKINYTTHFRILRELRSFFNSSSVLLFNLNDKFSLLHGTLWLFYFCCRKILFVHKQLQMTLCSL